MAIAKWDNSFDVEACEREIAAMREEKAARKALLSHK
jgi:aerobic C4-dicarboxylate transport protein